MAHSDYLAFLRRKIKLASFAGFDIPDDEINPSLPDKQGERAMKSTNESPEAGGCE